MKKETSAVKAHAKFSASGSKRWLACPGSIKLSESAPAPSESKYAKEGTTAHEVVEVLVNNREKRLAAAEMLRKKYPTEMVIHAETTLKYIEKRLAEHDGADLFVEVKADLPVSEPGQFGTADIVVAEHFGRLIVIDYKYGAGIPVYPTDKDGKLNSQLVYYALGVAHQFDYNFTDVEIVIVQPRAYVGNGETIRSQVFTIEELHVWREIFENGIKAAKAEDAPLRAAPLGSEDYCKFCPAAPICPEIKNKALRAAQADFDDETSAITVPEPKKATSIPVKNLPAVLAATYQLEKWICAVRDHAAGVLSAGGTIQGFAMNPGRKSRKWRDEEKVIKRAQLAYGYEAFDLISPAQFEKAFKDKYAQQFLAENVVEEEGSPVLGVAKPPKAGEDFDDLGF